MIGLLMSLSLLISAVLTAKFYPGHDIAIFGQLIASGVFYVGLRLGMLENEFEKNTKAVTELLAYLTTYRETMKTTLDCFKKEATLNE